MNNDITIFMSEFINSFSTVFKDLFNLLNSITFGNVSLLTFFISICLIGTFIPIIISVVRSYSANVRADKRYEDRYMRIREKIKKEKEGS